MMLCLFLFDIPKTNIGLQGDSGPKRARILHYSVPSLGTGLDKEEGKWLDDMTRHGTEYSTYIELCQLILNSQSHSTYHKQLH